MLAEGALARLYRDRAARAGLIVLGAMVLFALLGPLLIPHDPLASDFTLARDAAAGPPGPSLSHPLGTDGLFRDLLARLASGARLSLGIAAAATALSVGVGTCVGIASGLAEGSRAWIVDSALMRLVDAMLALPFLLFVTALGAALGQSDAGTTLLVLGLTGWMGTARVVRERTREIGRRDFVLAARALGGGTLHVVRTHVLPSLTGTLLVLGATSVGQMILAEAVLSYLTLGTQPPAPSWGRMLHEAEPLLRIQLLKMAAPGFAILLTVLATSRVAEGLQAAFEPGARRSQRRRAPFDLLMAAAVLLLVAVARPPELVAPSGTLRGEAKPERGGTLRLAMSGTPRSLDPALAYDEATTPIVALIFARLVTWDEEGRITPDLAERFEASEDARTYAFTLRSGLRFHDGAELRARDVVRSIERALHPTTPSPGASYYASLRGFGAFRSGKAEHLEGVRAEGELRVIVELSEPDATLLPLMTLGFAAPVCPSMGSRVDARSPALPCGAGPFRLASFEPESQISLARYEGYHVPGRPYLDAIEWTTGVPAHAQRYRFEDASIDVLRELSSFDSARFAADRRWSGLSAWVAKKAMNGVFLNTEVAPFDSVAVRRAVALAVDPSVLAKVRADVAETDRILPPSVPGPPRSRRMRVHDPARALAEMAAAGFAFDPATGKGGYPREIDYVAVPDTFQQQEAEVIAQQLGRIGLRVRLRLLPHAAYLAEASRRRSSAMGWRGWVADFPDPANFFESTLSSAAIRDEGSQNASFFSNAELDGVLAAAHRERGEAARMALYERAEEIVRDLAPWVPLTVPRSMEVWQPYVHGYAPHPFLPAQLASVWLDAGGRATESAGWAPFTSVLPAAAGARGFAEGGTRKISADEVRAGRNAAGGARATPRGAP